jgi:hypothetical protein
LEEDLSDRELIEKLEQRLKAVRASAAEALEQCTRAAAPADGTSFAEAFARYGVDPPVLKQFAAQLMYAISSERAARFLRAKAASQTAIMAVPAFLELFSSGRAQPSPAAKPKLAPEKERTTPLSEKEKALVSELRAALFEQRSEMRKMFAACDRDGDGFVDIEEFLHALAKAGVPVDHHHGGHGIDRKAISVSVEEATHLVAFFDRDGDGLLSYSEFMRLLQHTKTSIMSSELLKTEA